MFSHDFALSTPVTMTVEIIEQSVVSTLLWLGGFEWIHHINVCDGILMVEN